MLVERAFAVPSEADRAAVCAAIQEHLDREVLVVPLLVPRRVAAGRPGTTARLRLDHDLYRTVVAPAADAAPR